MVFFSIMATNQKRHYFNELARRWDELPSPSDATEKVRRFVDRAIRPGARRVLDVGGGTGILLLALLERCDPGAQLVELDLAESMLAESARKFSDSRVRRVCADARCLPWRQEALTSSFVSESYRTWAMPRRRCGDSCKCSGPEASWLWGT